MGQKGEQGAVESSSQMSDSSKSTSAIERKDQDSAVESSENPDFSKPASSDSVKQGENENLAKQTSEQTPHGSEANEELRFSEVETAFAEKVKETNEEPGDNTTADGSKAEVVDGGSGEKIENTSEDPKDNVTADTSEAEATDVGAGDKTKDTSEDPEESDKEDREAEVVSSVEVPEQKPEKDEQGEFEHNIEKERLEESFPNSLEPVHPESAKNLENEESFKEISPALVDPEQAESTSSVGKIEDITSVSTTNDDTGILESDNDKNTEKEDVNKVLAAQALDMSSEDPTKSRESSASDTTANVANVEDNTLDMSHVLQYSDSEAAKTALDLVKPLNDAVSKAIELNQHLEKDAILNEKHSSTIGDSSDSVDSLAELEKVKKEMKMMEAALHGAARQAQAKADEIAKLMNENEELKAVIIDLRRKTSEVDIEFLREEYHQRLSALERKIYALTKERDTLRREQNKRSDAAALLKEKDEIITQVMAEGEELSKKQAAQESHIRKLRAQVRELEEEKKGFLTKIQVEENKVESIKKDKAATEQLLQETIEKHQAELATQKEYYTKALNAAKEAEAFAEARANSEARTEIESRLRETEDRESMLIQTLEELRQTLSRREQQAAFREDMLCKDIEDLQKRYQASERRCEELVMQVPESTRPLLRQIEAMQETASRRAEGWAAVERSLNSRLQEAEARAAASEEKERSVNERLSQTLSRINVLEAQISCLRAEQTQLTRSLEKERQKAAEHRQEYLALKEVADTHESHARQLEDEIKEIKKKHKEELHELRTHQELLQQEIEREKAARFDQERSSHLSVNISDQSPRARQKSAAFENSNLPRRTSSACSLNSMEESYLLQTTLGSPGSYSENRIFGEGASSPYYMRSLTSSAFEASLRQKEGEIASYASRLASMESIRDSLAEELVKLTAQCEKLRIEAATLPKIRAELDALRRRHSAALELMGERDEELEELRADIVDLKEMYREQVNLLVNKIQRLSSSMAAA
ncbi:golgin candidate 5-like isoform X2 [Andrographis paniculata]|nr:golgin candidate 5-like isoform X2 [Andrographis paniculata]